MLLGGDGSQRQETHLEACMNLPWTEAIETEETLPQNKVKDENRVLNVDP